MGHSFDRLLPTSKKDYKMISPQILAYVGDSVFECAIRSYLVCRGDFGVADLHKQAVKYVKASAQASFVYALEEFFTEEETRIIKRGRNAKSNTVPKNANLNDYKYATGLESLVGYLYLKGDLQRLDELLDKIIERAGMD